MHACMRRPILNAGFSEKLVGAGARAGVAAAWFMDLCSRLNEVGAARDYTTWDIASVDVTS